MPGTMKLEKEVGMSDRAWERFILLTIVALVVSMAWAILDSVDAHSSVLPEEPKCRYETSQLETDCD